MATPLIRSRDGAPAALAAEYGTVSAVCAMGDAESGRFAWGALLAAAGSQPAWLVTGSVTPAALTPPDDLRAHAHAALAAGHIKVLRHRLGRPTPSQLRTMLAELEFFSPPAHSLMLLDCGDHWFDDAMRPGRSTLIESLRHWAQRRDVAVVLMFHTPTIRALDASAELMVFSRHLGGIARLARLAEPGCEPDALSPIGCHVLFWFGLTLITDTTFALAIDRDGAMRAVADVSARPQPRTAIDTGKVVAQRSALAGSGGVPLHWTVCDTLGDVLAACDGALAATVILCFDRTTPRDPLMLAVYRLRKMAGSRLKIIVRELQVRMRYNEEALMARLGANLIVPMEIGYARFLSMMEMVQSQSFNGRLPATFEAALGEGEPDPAQGYLAPATFARSVSETLARSRLLAIDNVLVRLTLANGLTPLDAMRHCSLKRAGDLFTADRKSVLVFLFACREMDATQTLERIFALPISELFGSEHRYIANLASQSAIEEFAQRARAGRLPDLSDELQRMADLRSVPPAMLPVMLPVMPPGVGSVFNDCGLTTLPLAARATTTVVHRPLGMPVHTPLRLRIGTDSRALPAVAILSTLP